MVDELALTVRRFGEAAERDELKRVLQSVVEHVRERYLVRIRELLTYFAGSGEVSLEIGSLPRAAMPALAW